MYDRSGEFSAETMLHAASVAHDDFDDRPLGLSSLPPNIRASTTLALADLVHDCNSPSQNLEIALHQAADSGMLAQCVRSLNQGLQKAGQGLKLEEISHMPVGAPRAFNVTKTDQQGKLTLFVIDGFVEPRPADNKTLKSPISEPMDSADPRELQKLKEQLELDVKCGKFEVLNQLKKVVLRQLEHFGSPGLIKKLALQAREGNKYSRDALSAVLVPAHNAEKWQSGGRLSGNYFTTHRLPDIERASRKHEIRLAALEAMRDLSTGAALTRVEYCALGLHLADAAARNDSKAATTVRSLFEKVYRARTSIKTEPVLDREYAKRTENLLNGLYDALASIRPTSESARRELVVQYGQVAASDNNCVVFEPGEHGAGASMLDTGTSIKWHVAEVKSKAMKGDLTSLEILALFAGGVARNNSSVNTFIVPYGKTKFEPGDSLARESRDILIAYSSTSQANRSLVIKMLTAQHQRENFEDQSRKLETLGLIAARSPSDVSNSVLECLQDGLRSRKSQISALKGLLAVGNNLRRVELSAIVEHISPDIINALPDCAGSLPSSKGQELAELLALRALDKDGKLSTEQRVKAMEALAALGKVHSTVTALAMLQSFGGEVGRRNLETELAARKYDYPTRRDVSAAATTLQDAAADCLLRIAETSVNQRVKADAFSAFASRSWNTFCRDSQNGVPARLVALLRSCLENSAVRHGVPKLVYDINNESLQPPQNASADASADATTLASIAAGFRDASGTVMPEEVLSFFSRRAISIHGEEAVKKVLSRIALFNALPEGIRLQLTRTATPLPSGQELHLEGKAVSFETINKLPGELRRKLTGSADKLPPAPWKGGRSAVLSAEEFNALPDDLRKALTAYGVQLDAIVVLSLLANGRIKEVHSSAHILLGPPALEKSIDEMRREATLRNKEEEANLTALQRCKVTMIEALKTHAKDGVGWLNKLAADRELRGAVLMCLQMASAGSISADFGSDEYWGKVQSEFIRKEDRLLKRLTRHIEPTIAHQIVRAQEAQCKLIELEMACINQRYSDLVHQGRADGARIKVVVKEGTHVTLSCVDALVARVAENGVVPTVLEFDLLHGWLGSATESGKITIRTRAEDVNYMFTFDHESGHVYDFALDQKSPDYHNFIEEWKSIVRMNGDVLFEQAGMGGDKRPAGGRDQFIKNIIDNPRFLGDSDGHAISYYASSSELIGEMFALYMHEQRLRAAGRKVPGYWILLSEVVSPRDQRRAEVMFNFPELYHHLKQTLFFKFSAQRAARARMLVPHAKGESPAALLTKMFTEHGGNSREFRTTYEMLQNESIMKAREALADSMFALNHGINPEGFDAKKLSAQNAQTYENYRRFVQTDYQAHLDKSIPSGQREQIERAHRLFNETVVDLESLAKKRTNVVLRDLLESRR